MATCNGAEGVCRAYAHSFKTFNDLHRHPAADRALQQVAEVIGGSVRTTDTAYRYGGEEFRVVLHETSAVDAMRFAERLRKRIENRFSSGESAITASFGDADCATVSANSRALIEAADAALYESKNAGRNTAMLSSRPPVGMGALEDLLEGA